MTAYEDPELLNVFEHLVSLDPSQERIGSTIRQTLDQLYDGQHTGRFRWDDLYKTEKTHCGTLVEINLQREFDFGDGLNLDYLVVGVEVDCKYSQAFGGWMIPNEAHNEICLVVTASDKSSTFSAGVVRAREEWLNVGRNRDAKATLSLRGREQIHWLARDAALPPNVLLGLDRTDLDVIFSFKSGQKRVNELFRRAQLLPVGRGVVATVAQQEDYMKRVRGNGGARTALRPEGIVIFGQYAAHGRIMKALGLPSLRRGESLSARLVLSEEVVPWSTRVDGVWWRLATPEDPVEIGPELPRVSVAS